MSSPHPSGLTAKNRKKIDLLVRRRTFLEERLKTETSSGSMTMDRRERAALDWAIRFIEAAALELKEK